MHWRVGDVTVTRVEERIVAVPAASLLPGATVDLQAATGAWLAPYFEPDGRIRLSNHAFVVQTPHRVIVVDTCVGHGRERPLPGDAGFVDRLGDALPSGLAGVDVVVCTHMHFDHVGWNTVEVDGIVVPTFPNARYLFARTELAALQADDHFDLHSVSIEPVIAAGKADLVDTDHHIDRWVRLVPTPGHTPGHVSVVIESQGARALITGDAFHSPIQIAHPHVAAEPFDHDSAQSTATRASLLDDLQDTETLVLGTHFAPPTAGHVRTRGSERTFEPVDAQPVRPATETVQS
ncbi:MAG: MBL fold metallo-hydrolase [Acidimicrobiales bacterium]